MEKIGIFCSASENIDKVYFESARQIGEWMGQKKYPIDYDLKAIGKYVVLALMLFGISEILPFQNIFFLLSVRTVLLLLFVAYIVKVDFPLHQIPVINRLIKK